MDDGLDPWGTAFSNSLKIAGSHKPTPKTIWRPNNAFKQSLYFNDNDQTFIAELKPGETREKLDFSYVCQGGNHLSTHYLSLGNISI